ncbi:MAG TPA: hypothetical protein VIY52_22355 [Streptosporangiaceae bacterium]
MIREYTEKHGKPPSKRTIWLLGQQAAQNTRRTKAEARRTVAGQTGAAEPSDAQRLAAWEAQTVREEVQALSAVHEQAEQFARRAIPVLDESAKARAARIAHVVTGSTAKVAEGGRAQALAPLDVSRQLRLTAQAEANAWQQSADAEVRHDQAEAASAKALAGQLGAREDPARGGTCRLRKLVGQDQGSQRNCGQG